ncbi:predicted protein [Uncinocarpus reesii 1704]|uniref:Protein kinase domain-containing protein n=1 Tax=Uncinocarpus reesii (strain UAMH 1704) TaxID=336963 RepID=C4JUZ4_UNCRE|nr:uncharacterized protein UREG_04947 [Uncinocarpus reesii 1704]EEP80105.1 predicted protein [Uncinocarpus reesii 1704]
MAPRDGVFTIPAFVRMMTHGPVPERLEPMHKIYRRRYKAGVRHLSRCRDLFPPDPDTSLAMFRVDSREFQSRVDLTKRGARLGSRNYGVKFLRKLRAGKICRDIKDRFEIYGFVGKGTSAIVLAAREKSNPKNQYVLKIQGMADRKLWNKHFNPPAGDYLEVGTATKRYIPTEAIYLQLLSQCPRFPRLDSVYVHSDMCIIIMSAEAIVKHPEMERLNTNHPLLHQFPSYSGEDLIAGKTPRLTEIQVCKVASHLLQAMTYLMDLGLSHDDLSHWNYVVDEELNTTLLDLGFIHASPNEAGWRARTWMTLRATESLLAPEVAMKLSTAEVTPTNARGGLVINHPNDVRKQHLWRFGALIYDLLHGYAPWEPPDWDPEIGALRDFASFDMNEKRVQYIRERRQRMINEELTIDERLSQDCIDALRALLAKDEARRPTLREVASFPWFQGHWVDYPKGVFNRPPFLPRPPSETKLRTYSEQRS